MRGWWQASDYTTFLVPKCELATLKAPGGVAGEAATERHDLLPDQLLTKLMRPCVVCGYRHFHEATGAVQDERPKTGL